MPIVFVPKTWRKISKSHTLKMKVLSKIVNKKKNDFQSFFQSGCVDRSNNIIFIIGQNSIIHQMKVKVDSNENHPSVLHPRNLFWSVNLYMWGPTLVALLPEEDYEQAVALDIGRFFLSKR